MRKTALLLLTALLLFTAACSGGGTGLIPRGYPTDNTYHPETDCAYTTASAIHGQRIAETELGYYTLANCYLLFTDGQTMETVPVCAKPNCLHEQEPNEDKRKECNAYFHTTSTSGSICNYNGNLYVWHHLEYGSALIPTNAGRNVNNFWALTQISPDGVQRKTIRVIENRYPGDVCFHRGRFFYTSYEVDELGNMSAGLWSCSLSEPNAEASCIYQADKLSTGGTIPQRFSQVFGYGRYMYLREMIDFEMQSEQLRILDLTTGEWNIIENPEGKSAKRAVIHSDDLLVFFGDPQWYDSETVENQVDLLYRMEPDGSSPELLGNYPFVNVAADSEYLYMTEAHWGDRKKLTMYIYNREMTLVDQFTCDYSDMTDGYLGYFTVYPMQGETLLYVIRVHGDNVYGCFDRSAIGSGSIQAEEYFRFNRTYDYQSKLYD